MLVRDYYFAVLEELSTAGSRNTAADAERFAELVAAAGSVFVAGAGRSGLMGKAFAMRLMHMGLQAYVVGETVTPGIGEGDLLVLGSGSGETGSLIGMANKAAALGAQVGVVTVKPESTLGALADVTVQLSAVAKEQNSGHRGTIQPMASLFEQSLLLFYDAVILKLMEIKGLDSGTMYGSHANLE